MTKLIKMLLNNRSTENFDVDKFSSETPSILSMICSSPNSVALFEFFLSEKVKYYVIFLLVYVCAWTGSTMSLCLASR